MNTTAISFDLNTTDPSAALGFEFWVDNNLINDIEHVSGPQHLKYDISDNKGQHQLRLVLKNKTRAHTVLNDTGTVIKDATLEVTNLKFDDVDMSALILKLAKYRHRFNNPNNEEVIETFHRTLGCNGEVVLDFATPLYIWVLEGM